MVVSLLRGQFAWRPLYGGGLFVFAIIQHVAVVQVCKDIRCNKLQFSFFAWHISNSVMITECIIACCYHMVNLGLYTQVIVKDETKIFSNYDLQPRLNNLMK